MRFLSRSSRGSGENRPRLSTRPASHSPVPKRDNVIRLFADFHPEHRVGGINGLSDPPGRLLHLLRSFYRQTFTLSRTASQEDRTMETRPRLERDRREEGRMVYRYLFRAFGFIERSLAISLPFNLYASTSCRDNGRPCVLQSYSGGILFVDRGIAWDG